MAYIKKTSASEKMEELSKKIPTSLSWLIPDPYDPSSYIMPIGGIIKSPVRSVWQLLEKTIIGSSKRGGSKATRELLQRIVDMIKTETRTWNIGARSPAAKKALEKNIPYEALVEHIGRVSDILGEKADLTMHIPNIFGQRPRIPKGFDLNSILAAIGAAVTIKEATKDEE